MPYFANRKSMKGTLGSPLRVVKKGSAEASLDSTKCFSVIFRGGKTLDLMTTDQDDRDEILDALDRLLHAYQKAKNRVGNDVLLLRYIWTDVDRSKTNLINAAELGAILDRINYYMKKSQLNSAFEQFSKVIGLDRSERKRGLTFEQVVTFLHKLKRDTWQVKPVNQIWVDVFGEFMNNGKPRQRVSAQTFLDRFLKRTQGQEGATIEYVSDLFLRLNELEIANTSTQGQVEPGMRNRYITKDTFEAYLASNENSAFDPMREKFDEHNMSKPLSEYWINTSHNTYLTGDQLTSTSSVEMYMTALYRGCRCVELDIWDGDRDPRDGLPMPVVKHGHTMTSKIPFADILKSIKMFLNFNPYSYPIILSLENHCSIPYQEVMADQLTIILGSRLYVPDEASLEGPLPSPERLRGMVVLKGRRPLGADADDVAVYDSDDDESLITGTGTVMTGANTMSTVKASSVDIKIAPQLAQQTLFHGTMFRKWEDSTANPTHHMHSFSESKVRSLCRSRQSRPWVVYNQTHMSRTYPAGKRVDSSNYNPMLAWATGCQMVALNFQTSDAALRINDGRFRENGGCGYILKPSHLMIKERNVEPAPTQMTIKVLTGSCLPKPRGKNKGECIDPYVMVTLFDVNANEAKEICTSYRTGTVPENGFFPIWNTDRDRFKFQVENPTCAVLQLTVYDSDVGKDDFIASASIPISCLRQGYRCVRLYDANNTRSGAFDFATLLIRIKMKSKQAEI
jgi:phosphatidylinositol phospholipase C delta